MELSSSASTILKRGPIVIPINMSISTSGILFLLKISANQCAAKINVPKVNISSAGSIVNYFCKDKKKSIDNRQQSTDFFLTDTL